MSVEICRENPKKSQKKYVAENSKRIPEGIFGKKLAELNNIKKILKNISPRSLAGIKFQESILLAKIEAFYEKLLERFQKIC